MRALNLPDWIQFNEIGGIPSNNYVIERPRERWIIDPSIVPPPTPATVARSAEPQLRIIATHAHYDHLLALKKILSANPNSRFLIHCEDQPALNDPTTNVARLFGLEAVFPAPDFLLEDNDLIRLDEDLVLQVWRTPGHTPGSSCFLLSRHSGSRRSSDSETASGNCFREETLGSELGLRILRPGKYIDLADGAICLFTGDTLFCGGIGRTDLPGGSPRMMRDSLYLLHRRLTEMPPDLPVLSGHGPGFPAGDMA
ncbi:MAG: MBL fold metallo-hydrolase [Clostridiaceae bacterium]|nr:MBL fold metallo-hydrolase [Clostridiaceae bacterium]